MAKTYKNLYPLIYDFGNVHAAYIKARRCKRYKKDILQFSAHLEENLIDIQNRLIWKSYTPGPYKLFTIYEPKERIIAALPFRDRVVHHALCNVIEPLFERFMIYDSHACRAGQGVLSGVNQTTRYLRDARRRWGRVYCLKGDIAKFFPAIDHDILKRVIRKRIACPDTLGLIDAIIDSNGAANGLPIGNLTSQLWANVYLNELDHHLKDVFRVCYYVRYMDDFVIFHGDKLYLRDLLDEIGDYLGYALRLSLNGKTQIFPIGARCVDFLGYRIWPDYRLLRKKNMRHNQRKFNKYRRLYQEGAMTLDQMRPSIMSWLGHAKHADTWRLRGRVLGAAPFSALGIDPFNRGRTDHSGNVTEMIRHRGGEKERIAEETP